MVMKGCDETSSISTAVFGSQRCDDDINPRLGGLAPSKTRRRKRLDILKHVCLTVLKIVRQKY